MNKKLFNEKVQNLTTFLLIDCTEDGDLIVNKGTEELFLYITNIRQLVPLGVKYPQEFGPLHPSKLHEYPIL